MTGLINIQDDVTLQQMLTLMIFLPDNITIPYRMFVEVPQVDFDSVLDEELSASGDVMSDVYRNWSGDGESVYILLGEDSDSHYEPTSGGRNYVTNPMTKGELMAWVSKYQVGSFHVDYPRPVVEDVI